VNLHVTIGNHLVRLWNRLREMWNGCPSAVVMHTQFAAGCTPPGLRSAKPKFDGISLLYPYAAV
jgi:hypothetical protein